jgi:hypothetical protein
MTNERANDGDYLNEASSTLFLSILFQSEIEVISFLCLDLFRILFHCQF